MRRHQSRRITGVPRLNSLHRFSSLPYCPPAKRAHRLLLLLLLLLLPWHPLLPPNSYPIANLYARGRREGRANREIVPTTPAVDMPAVTAVPHEFSASGYGGLAVRELVVRLLGVHLVSHRRQLLPNACAGPENIADIAEVAALLIRFTVTPPHPAAAAAAYVAARNISAGRSIVSHVHRLELVLSLRSSVVIAVANTNTITPATASASAPDSDIVFTRVRHAVVAIDNADGAHVSTIARVGRPFWLIPAMVVGLS